MQIISIIQNKGGVGKTTITSNLAVCLATQKNKKVALIDFDSQANLSFSIKHKPKKDLKQLLEAKKPLKKEDFSPTDYKNLYLIPNNKDINSILFSKVEKETKDQLTILKKLLRNLKSFDYLLIDTPPVIDIQTMAVMVASNHIIIPIAYDIFSAIGLGELNKNINSAKKLNKNLDILGIVLCRFYKGRKLNKEMEKPLKENFGDKLFDTAIRVNTKFQQAQANRQDIFDFEKGDFLKRGTRDIDSLADEIINKLNKN